MESQIRLLKNNDKIELSDIELANKVYYYLRDDLNLGKKKAFQIIYYLQEYLPVIPDQIEQCCKCGELYDSYSQGHYSELTGKFYCSESCEPAGLYESEQKAEKRKDAPYQKWLKQLKKEQNHYPALKGHEINDGYLRRYFHEGKTPIDALNNILTLT
jgi:hypothetical protein